MNWKFWKSKPSEVFDEDIINTVNDMSREELVLTFVLGVIEGLVDKGVLQGYKSSTPKGKIIYRYLQSIKFAPTDEEYSWAMNQFKSKS